MLARFRVRSVVPVRWPAQPERRAGVTRWVDRAGSADPRKVDLPDQRGRISRHNVCANQTSKASADHPWTSTSSA